MKLVFLLIREQVEVYDVVSCTRRRHITVRGLGSTAWGLAACAHYKCLYVSDESNHDIYRADLTGSNAVTEWSVADRPRGLSVNRAHNVVVACHGANKLQEYTTHGIPVREICRLQAPFHAVQLSSGDYVVSQYRAPGAIVVVCSWRRRTS